MKFDTRGDDLHVAIGGVIDGSRSYVQRSDQGFQGEWVELTTFVLLDGGKRRLDFAWPEELFDSMTNDEIANLVLHAYEVIGRK